MTNSKNLLPPTPPEVKEAINVIVAYLRENNWIEAIISDSGGAAFYHTSVFDKDTQAVETHDHNT